MLKNKMVVIPGAVVLLLLVVGGYWFMFMQAPAAPMDEDELAKTPGPIYEMPEPFVVNLGGGQSFAKIGVALHVSELSAGEVPAGAGHGGGGEEAVPIHDDPIIRDIVIAEAQKASAQELATEKGRAMLKKHIKKRINKETHTHITDVYWTEFAVQ